MLRARSLALLLPLSCMAPPAGVALAQCELGYWETATDHDTTGFDPQPSVGLFNAVHMSLVVKGPHRGKVLVWDYEDTASTPAWGQRWSLIDVSTPEVYSFHNAVLTLPEDGGDFFCGGLAHTPEGDLFVAGGTTQYGNGSAEFIGGTLVYSYDPAAGPFGEWTRLPDLAFDRWYPTVTQIASGKMLVSGGKAQTGHGARNDYEAFDPATGAWEESPEGDRIFAGPQSPAGAFKSYPRLHQLASGDLFCSGEGGWSARMDHEAAPGVWTPTAQNSLTHRHDGAAFLVPRSGAHVVATLGGDGMANGVPIGPSNRFESCWASAPGAPDWDWVPQAQLNQGREKINLVLLPDASMIVFGGRIRLQGVPEAFTAVPERYTFEDGFWSDMAEGGTPRDYHSTAMLLPDGRVLTGGGERRTVDYQVYVPPYIACGAERPVIVSAPERLEYDRDGLAPYTLEFAPMSNGDVVERVVLMKPGSTTHHSDMDMRYVELQTSPYRAERGVGFFAPRTPAEAPRGYYMLFLVSADGIPSVAHWVKLE